MIANAGYQNSKSNFLNQFEICLFATTRAEDNWCTFRRSQDDVGYQIPDQFKLRVGRIQAYICEDNDAMPIRQPVYIGYGETDINFPSDHEPDNPFYMVNVSDVPYFYVNGTRRMFELITDFEMPQGVYPFLYDSAKVIRIATAIYGNLLVNAT